MKDLEWDIQNLVGKLRVGRDECKLEIQKLCVKQEEYTKRIMELENLLDHYKQLKETEK